MEMKQRLTSLESYPENQGPVFSSYRLISQYVPMKDGTRLAVDIYLPQNEEEDPGPLPLVLHYTPYARRKYTGKTVGGKPETATTESIGLLPLTQYGYVVVIAEPRGTGASFGIRQVVNSRQEAQDGAELVEWLAAQPFCNGKIGTAGLSYHGQTQLGILSQCPEHLCAAFIGHTDFNRYDGWMRNGIPRGFGRNPDEVWEKEPEALEQQLREMAKNIVPVDGDEDKVLLLQALREHVENGSQVALQKNHPYRDCEEPTLGGKIWDILSASTYLEDINRSGVAVYVAGGAYDVFRRDTFMMYQNLKLPKKLLFGPWYHVGSKSDPRWLPEIHRWFDYWLKGIQNGILDEDPITFKLTHYNFDRHAYNGEGTGSFYTAEDWPVSQGTRTYWYPSLGTSLSGSCWDNGILIQQPAEDSLITYQAVNGIRTDVETTFTTREDGWGADQKGITFTSAPLQKDLRIIGHPMARIVLELDPERSPDCSDLDVLVLLSDYNPDTQEAFQFSEGHLRASLRATAKPPYDFLGLPWHSCTKDSIQPLKAGQPYRLLIDLMPACYELPQGHCLRLTLVHSLDRLYCLDYGPSAPKIRLYLGENGTSLELPNLYEEE